MARPPRKLPLQLDPRDDDEDEREEGLEPYEGGEDEDEPYEIEDTEDGGAIIRFGDDEDADDGDWWDNLATEDNELEATRIAGEYLELIERDREARKRRDEQYAEGIRRTGLGDEAPGGADFEGASKVVHPLLIEACIDFASSAIKELFPPEGPVRDRIEGTIDAKKVAKAQRKTRLMNWQLTHQCREFRAELEQLLTQLPMGGSQYLKIEWMERRNRPHSLFTAVDEMLLPFAATNFYTAQRKTHVEYITAATYAERVAEGRYRDVDLPSPSAVPDASEASKASDRIEGRDASAYNEDGLRRVYNVYTTVDLGDIDPRAEGEAPYILVIDDTSQRIMSIYRNWDEDDATQEELQHFVEFAFIPWRGAYALGLPHIIGGIAASSTGALRALLDSAHINNTPSGVKLKNTKVSGQSKSVQPGEIVDVEGSYATDDIRKLVMPFPYNQPSPVLFRLLGFLSEAGRGVVRTALDDTGDLRPDAPVGTTLARIEQGLKVYSAIHSRLHDAMGRVLSILHRLNATYLDDEALEREVGEKLATSEDFKGPMDVTPVSDPRIFSETQRMGQAQAVAQRADAKPDLYDARKVEERILETLRIPDAKDLLQPMQEPKEQNAANENTSASLGRPVMAFPAQDHIAHLKTHIAYMMHPIFGANSLIAPQLLPVMLGHIREHVALWYSSAIFDMLTQTLGEDAGDVLKDIRGDEQGRKALDQLIAEASILVLAEGGQALESIPAVVQQAQQLLQQLQPPPMTDPRVQIEQQKLQQKAQQDERDFTLQQQRVAFDSKESENNLALRAQELQQRIAELRIKETGDTLRNREDNQTAMQLATMEMLSDEQTSLRNGRGINPNPQP